MGLSIRGLDEMGDSINTSPPTPGELPRPQTNPSRTDELPSLQYGDWVEAKAYDEN